MFKKKFFYPRRSIVTIQKKHQERPKHPPPPPKEEIMNMRTQFIFLVTELQQFSWQQKQNPENRREDVMWSVGRKRGGYLTECKEVLVESGCLNEEVDTMEFLSQYTGWHRAAVAATVESQVRRLQVWFRFGLFLEFSCSVASVHICETLARGPNLARNVISFGPWGNTKRPSTRQRFSGKTKVFNRFGRLSTR